MTEVSMDDTSTNPITQTSPNGVLSRRLLVLIICCSTVLTLFATGIQLYIEYRTDIEKMNANVRFIQSSYIPALARSLYELNDEQLILQLDGALQLNDIVYLQIIENVAGEVRQRSVGSENYRNLIRDEFEMTVEVSGKPFRVGTLIVESTTDNITRKILARATQILTINATKTFVVALLMLWIIQSVVTRHIADMAHWADGISLNRLFDKPFILNRKATVEDELQHVAHAINKMRKRIASDITKKEALEAEARKLTQDLHHSEKLQAIGELAGGIAHDFNNQLHVILANADLLREQFPNSPEALQFSDNIIKSCKSSSDLIANLMNFSRKDINEKVSINMNDLTLEVSELLKLGAGQDIKVLVDLQAEKTQVFGDPSLLQNALLNIGLNARDALTQGGEIFFETKNVELEPDTFATGPDKKGWFLQCSISDTGSGIHPKDMPRIFEPFFTTKTVGKGTGMGLSAVYGAVQSHNAIIDVSSKKNQGTRFDIYLPLQELENA
jgi:signal transduction histidine kinase